MSNSDSNSHQKNNQNTQQQSQAEAEPRKRAAHQDFRWVDGLERDSPHVSFIETALDISSGIHTCLQIVYSSELERAGNLDADDDLAALPAVGVFDADKLLRLSIATAGLLRNEARRRVELLNEETAGT